MTKQKGARGGGGLQLPEGVPAPKVLALDLDATVWEPEMYMLDGPPFKQDRAAGVVYDRSGERIYLMGETRSILSMVASDERWAETEVAYVSRTEYPAWANKCLKLFELEGGLDLHTLGVHKQIYPGGKKTHFRAIHQDTGIGYSEYLFFDNERWNCTDVAPLGVCCVYCPDGLTQQAWEMGLRKWAEHVAERGGGGGSSSGGARG